MTSTVDLQVLNYLSRGEAILSTSVGVVLLAVLGAALVAKVLLQSADSDARRDEQRLLDVVVFPLLLVFGAIVIERFVVLT
jgi:hypothetical protein